MTALKDSFTSTGHKLGSPNNREAMESLRDGKGQAITAHIMVCDACNHRCSFCSVGQREGDSLVWSTISGFLDIMCRHGLKAVILSGGGNPILYRCKETGKTINDVIEHINSRGLQCALITNGMPTKMYENGRISYKTLRPECVDMLTWIRISMSGLDHEENEVYVPDIDTTKTTLGFSYVFADVFHEETVPHRQVSTVGDIVTKDRDTSKDRLAMDRVPELTRQIANYAKLYRPRYVRLLPDCLATSTIAERSIVLQGMAEQINAAVGYDCAFVQTKHGKAPRSCFQGVVHPVLSTDSYVYPCDSVTLSAAEMAYREGRSNHRFDSPWRICHWSEVEKLYTEPLHSLVDPQKICNGCVFTVNCNILDDVVNRKVLPESLSESPTHEFFV